MTAKPRYTGTDANLKTAKFSPNFERYLRRYYAEYIEPCGDSDLGALEDMTIGFKRAGKQVERDSLESDTTKKKGPALKLTAEANTPTSVDVIQPADEFISHLFEETRSTIDSANGLSIRLTKKEIVREIEDIRYFFESTYERLKNLSDDVDRMIANGPFVIEMLSDMEGFLDEIKRVQGEAKQLKRLPRTKVEKTILVELTIAALRALRKYGINPSQPTGQHFKSRSPALDLLVKFSEEIGLNRSPETMRNIVGDAKKSAPDLRA